MTNVANQANVTWGKATAKANVTRVADTAANRTRLQAEAAKDRLPSAVVDMGKDVVLLSGAALTTASRLAGTAETGLYKGNQVSVDGVLGTVLTSDSGFNEIDTTGVVVAVIDTGLDVAHPALAGRVVKPFNVLDGSTDVSDHHGHGTHVAGIVAGAWDLNANAGGVDPNAKIMPIKCSENGSFRASNVAKAIRYAADNGAQVINMSLGGNIWLPYIEDAIKYAESKGVTVVAATGNDGRNKVSAPARFDGVLAVGTSANGKRSKFSNGGDQIAVTAPGDKIVSSLPGGKYGEKSGTSMSSPYVAGAAALVVAQHPDWTPAQVKAHLSAAVDDLGTPGWDRDFGYGQLNLFKAAYGENLPAVTRPAAPPKVSFWDRVKAFFHLG